MCFILYLFNRQFYSQIGIVIQKPDGSFLSAIDLPDIDITKISASIASIPTPSGVNLTLANVVSIGPLFRYSLGWDIYLNQAIARFNISSLLDTVLSLLPPGE
jgi:hypothetical protein